MLRIYPHIHFTYSPFKILEFQALMDGLTWHGDERALDIGCGEGLQTFLIGQKCAHVTGVDVNPDFIVNAQWFARHLQGDIESEFLASTVEDAHFPENTFDRIFSICVIEHIPHHAELLAECLRILKPGGQMVFSVDTLEAISSPELLRKHSAAHHVVKYYRQDELALLLSEIGFAEVEVRSLFRSELACELFTRGIERGFNFGRFRASALAKQLARAEGETPADAPGIFLVASARKPTAQEP